MDKLQVLKDYFGNSSFRRGQENIIDAILEGKDVLGIMPTGSGKSVCYQIPAVIMEGITLVISPLISLMRDQVTALIQTGIPAAYLNSSLTPGQFSKALSRAAAGAYKIIYVAPERLESFDFLSFAVNSVISMVTVDEAHCVSQWGQDFRPSYLKITDFVNKLPRRPVVAAFTATATRTVKNDIINHLNLDNPLKVSTGYNRENLYFGVRKPKNKLSELINIINSHRDQNGIVYCFTRKTVEQVYEELCERGINAAKYHAGLTDKERRENQDDFIYDRKNIIVATNAFGMGIDKSNVRYVVHYNMPKDIESYYQEAGRAGRDGEPSDCILLYSDQDVVINKYLIDMPDNNPEIDPETKYLLKKREYERLNIMEGYCRAKGCLRRYILNYFGEALKDDCRNCSYCGTDFIQKDITEEAEAVVKCVSDYNERYGIMIIRDTLKGSRSARSKRVKAENQMSYGVMGSKTLTELNELLNTLIDNDVIILEGEYPVIKLTDIGREVLKGERKVVVKAERTVENKAVLSEKKTTSKRKSKEAEENKRENEIKKSEEIESLPVYEETDVPKTLQEKLFDELKKLRIKLAGDLGLPPYIIFSDKSLLDMGVKLPTNDVEFLEISGVGQEKLKKYGKDFTEAINRFTEENPDAAKETKENDVDFYSLLRENIDSIKISEEPLGINNFLKSVFSQLNIETPVTSVREYVYNILIEKEAICISTDAAGGEFKDITPKSEELGIIMTEKFNKSGLRYRHINFTAKGQRFILNELLKKEDDI
ncbi:MAG: DNA helicase RecQ [Eubacterium sp.]|nr:DNA helicase RecQ [Eubacterium sp.]